MFMPLRKIMWKEDRRQIAVEIGRVLKGLAAASTGREVMSLGVKRGNSSGLIPTHLSLEGITADILH